jgi:hypothetical protein
MRSGDFQWNSLEFVKIVKTTLAVDIYEKKLKTCIPVRNKFIARFFGQKDQI